MNGRVKLGHGSEEQQRAVREWADNFMPEVVTSLPRLRARRSQTP